MVPGSVPPSRRTGGTLGRRHQTRTDLALYGALRRRISPISAGTSLPREANVDMERIDERAADGGEAPKRTLEVHFKLFGTDGVSLQSQELSKALGARGWRAFSCASDVPPHADGLTLPELSYQSPDAVALRKRIFSTSERSSAGVGRGQPRHGDHQACGAYSATG